MQPPAVVDGSQQQSSTPRLLSKPGLSTIFSYILIHTILHTEEEVGELCIQPDHARIHASQFALKCHAIRVGPVDLADELLLHDSAGFRRPVIHEGVMNLFKWVITSIAPLFIVSSPVTSYADQIWSIHKNRSSQGFSLDIPLIMLTCSVLKLFYWFGARYDFPLLIQASVMIVVQVVLLHVALLHRGPVGAQHSLSNPFAGSHEGDSYVTRPYHFWQWRSRKPYWQFLLYYTLILALLQFLVGSKDYYIQIQGYVALSIEAILPVPQIIQNGRAKSCKGFRLSVLVNWLVGDAFKLSYFYLSDGAVPLAFKLCGIFQTGCDMYLGIQYYMYGEGQRDMIVEEKIPHAA